MMGMLLHIQRGSRVFPFINKKAYSSQQSTNKLVTLGDLGEYGAQSACPGGVITARSSDLKRYFHADVKIKASVRGMMQLSGSVTSNITQFGYISPSVSRLLNY